MKERRDKDPWVTQAYLCLVDQAENSIIVVLWGKSRQVTYLQPDCDVVVAMTTSQRHDIAMASFD